MSIVYKLTFSDGSYYYGKSVHNTIEERYGSTLESYLKNASSDKIKAKLNECGLPSVEIIDKTNDWNQTDKVEEFLIRFHINNEKCLNHRFVFTPIKKSFKTGLEEDLVLYVADLLKHTDMTFTQISLENDVSLMSVTHWNKGAYHKELLESHGFDLPIREVSKKSENVEDDVVLKAADLLKNSNMSLKEIALKLNVNHNNVSAWNNGRNKKDLLLSHGHSLPVRKNNNVSDDEILRIADLIKNSNLSLRKIGVKMNRSLHVVVSVNNGKLNKDLLLSHGHSLPLRP